MTAAGVHALEVTRGCRDLRRITRPVVSGPAPQRVPVRALWRPCGCHTGVYAVVAALVRACRACSGMRSTSDHPRGR